MPARIVKQPNGRYARFSTVVDNFTHYNMTREEALDAADGYGFKVSLADMHPGRFTEALDDIRIVHGQGEANKIAALLSRSTEEE